MGSESWWGSMNEGREDRSVFGLGPGWTLLTENTQEQQVPGRDLAVVPMGTGGADSHAGCGSLHRCWAASTS